MEDPTLTIQSTWCLPRVYPRVRPPGSFCHWIINNWNLNWNCNWNRNWSRNWFVNLGASRSAFGNSLGTHSTNAWDVCERCSTHNWNCN